MYSIHPDPIGYMNAELEDYKVHSEKLPFHPNDMRTVYHQLTFDILNNYYLHACFQELSRNAGLLQLPDTIEKTFDLHWKRIVQLGEADLLQHSFRSSNNRRIVLDTWSAFEFAISELCLYMLTQEEIDNLLLDQYLQLKEKTKKLTVEAALDDKMKQVLRKRHLSHVPITRKCDAIFKKAKDTYNHDIAFDKDFLLFFGRLRNCIHSNFIYHGSDTKYEFQGVEFVFEDNKTLCHNPVEFDSSYFYRMAAALGDVFTRITFAIRHDEIIPYPDLTAP